MYDEEDTQTLLWER